MRRVLASLPVLFLIGACGGKIREESRLDPSDPCTTAVPRCPNDPPIDEASRQFCHELTSGACGAEYRALLGCSFASIRCVDGISDPTPLYSACQRELAAYQACGRRSDDVPPPPG